MSSRRASARAEKRRITFRRTTSPIDPRNRLVALLLAFVVIGAGFVAVLVDLQTVRPQRFRDLGQDQRTKVREIAGYRGAITDRNGFVLAASTPSHQIVADPQAVLDPRATAALLAPILGIDSEVLTTELTPSSPDDHFSLLARHVKDGAVAQVEELRSVKSLKNAMIGIWVKPEERRVYPAGDLATALVGRVDPDEQGIFGVEKLYNQVMTGQPGSELIERGRFGSIAVGARKVNPATAGFDVVLTIDHRIQFTAEQALLEHCRAAGAAGATAVVTDPRSNEILAMASVVRRDGDCRLTDYNAALVDAFEPGSALKPLVVAAATEEAGLTADSMIEVPPRITIGGKTFVDHPPHPAASFPVSQILAESMNVGTIKISQKLSAEIIYGYLQRFGLTKPSGLDFPGETTGSLRQPADWHGSDNGSIPIGQGMTVNAAQLLSAYNVIASGGTFSAPTVVRSIDTKDGVIHSGTIDPPRQVISARTAQEITRSMEAVVERGTGREAAIPGYTVAGKTGTAWKVFDDGSGKTTYGSDGNRRYIVTFGGFLPAADPQLSMVVVVDEPVNGTTASVVAAPIFSQIGDYAARVLLIPPDKIDAAVDPGTRVRSTPAPGLLTLSGDGSAVVTGPLAPAGFESSPATSPVELAADEAGDSAAAGHRSLPDSALPDSAAAGHRALPDSALHGRAP
jgi:cell division protein FtsI (penicillin-binding protein 3)